MEFDIIVIGGGLGGLTAGAKLAKEGRNVLLLEQHDRPGGCATTFRRGNYTMEVGLHEMDGMDGRDMKTRIFRDLGVSDHCTFLKAPEFYRFVSKRVDVVIPHDAGEAKTRLTKLFPDQEQGITAYFNQVINARKHMKRSEEKEERSLGDFMDSIITDNDLKLVLLGNLGYYHDDPYSVSLNYYSMAQGSYYSGGGLYIQGGSQRLSDTLAACIEQNGGKVLLKHLVTKILVEKSRAVGVKFKRTAKSDAEEESAMGREIIANAAIPNVAARLLPDPYAEKLSSEVKKREIGASLLTVYFGFNKPLREIGNRHYSTFLFDPSVESQEDIPVNNRGPFEKRSFTFVDYSQIDSRLAPEGKSVGAICCIDYLSDWEDLDREAYREKKEDVARIFMEKMEGLIPGFKNAVEFYEVGTSRTVKRFTLNPGGAVYGFAQTPERASMDEISSIENLHYASAWTSTGGGFSGAIFSGYMCAFNILRTRSG